MRSAAAPTTTRLKAKVPEIGLIFWAIKLLTTGMGESASDFLSEKDLLLAGLVGVLGLVVTLVLQFRADRYRPPIYWSAVAMIAVAIVVPWLLWRFAGLNSVAAFWAAYVLTRPLGASLADWAGKRDGLGLGDGTVTLIVLLAVVGLVGRLQWTATRGRPAAGLQ